MIRNKGLTFPIIMLTAKISEDDKIKGIIYVYDAAESKWISGTADSDTDMVPITGTEIDSLFAELWPTT